MHRIPVMLILVLVLASCADQTPNSPTSPSASAPAAESAALADTATKLPFHIEHPVLFPVSQAFVVFPPRNEPNQFFADLQLVYRDVLRRPQTTSHVDPEGQNVWLTEYFRFYLNGCSHQESMERTLRQITTGATQPVCGAERTEFPPRNLPNEFQGRLEATYRDVLRAPEVPTYVDSEGANVWLAQYLRFRLGTTPDSACDHATAQSKVFAEIRGLGVQPPCGPQTQFGPGQYRVNVDIQPGRYFNDPIAGCSFQRLRGFGGSASDAIVNELLGFNAGQWIVDILPTDAGFQADAECGTWFSAPRTGALNNIPPGRWLVGSQITPGTYAASTRPGCQWERLRDFTGNASGVIANELAGAGGQRVVTIAASDVGFSANDECGSWSRATASTPLDPR